MTRVVSHCKSVAVQRLVVVCLVMRLRALNHSKLVRIPVGLHVTLHKDVIRKASLLRDQSSFALISVWDGGGRRAPL